MRWCRVLARLECVCGVVVLLPQVCNTCQVTLAVMGIIVCLTCKRICSLRCIGCLIVSTCCHGFVVCCVGEKSLSLLRCCSVTVGTNAAVFVCYCDVCHVCCSILCQVTEVHLFIIWHCMAWTIEAFCEALCLSLFFEQSHVPQTCESLVVSYACRDCEWLDCIWFSKENHSRTDISGFQYSSK